MSYQPIFTPIPHTPRRLPLDKLKCCPLCNSLNAKRNVECFVCGWRGDFDTDPEQVTNALHELVLQCPAIIDIIEREPVARQSFLHRMIAFLRRPRRAGRFDIQA